MISLALNSFLKMEEKIFGEKIFDVVDAAKLLRIRKGIKARKRQL